MNLSLLLLRLHFHLIVLTDAHTYILFFIHLLLAVVIVNMSVSTHSNFNTKFLLFNIMDLRGWILLRFHPSVFWKKIAELLSFQECNSIDSFLRWKDVTAILHLESDQLIDLKKNMGIVLSNGSIRLLPGLESTITNLSKLLKKKENSSTRKLNDFNQLLLFRLYQLPASASLFCHQRL